MYGRLSICLLCPKHIFYYFQEEKYHKTCFYHFPSDLLYVPFSARQVCIFSLVYWVWFLMREAPAHVPEKRLVIEPTKNSPDN